MDTIGSKNELQDTAVFQLTKRSQSLDSDMSGLRVARLGVFIFVGILLGAQTGVVSGFVREAETGEFIGYASVYLSDNSIGTSTNRQGYYVLSGIPPGKHTLVVSMIGYEEQTVEIQAKSDSRLRRDFYLKRAPLGMETVEVTAERARFEHEVDIGVQHIDITEFRKLPTLGEEDLFRSLEMLPGVISVSDFTSALYIRGGTADQNLVLFDGIPIYNPYHLLGAFSTFIIEPLEDAELYTGGFPARYGGAASSVLDVRMRNGSKDKVKACGELGLLTAKLTAEGPLPWNVGSWIVSGRRTYIDAATWAIDEIFSPESFTFYSLLSNLLAFNTEDKPFYFPYHFHDVQAKIGVDVGDRTRLTLTGLVGEDLFDYEDSLVVLFNTWGNSGAGLELHHVISPKLLTTLASNITRYRYKYEWSNTTISEHFYPYDSTIHVDTTFEQQTGNSRIGGVNLRWGFSWFPRENHSIRWGTDASITEITELFTFYRGVNSDGIVYEEEYENELRDSFWLAGVYIDYKWEPTALWVLETGLRGEYFANDKSWRVSPRLGLKKRITADWAINTGAGLYYQYLFIPYSNNEYGTKVPLDFFQPWVIADTVHPPLQSEMISAGTEYLFPSNGSVSLEIYFKDQRNLQAWSSDSLGQGYSYGAEFILKRGSSWLGYTYSQTRYQFDEEWFYPLQDSRHNINISISIPLPKAWQVNASWVYNSGFPHTGVLGWQQCVDPHTGNCYWLPLTSSKGGMRYPDYHRLDVGVSKQFRLFKRCDASFYFQVLNVYARDNVLLYNYYLDCYNGEAYRSAIYMLPLPVPSLGLKVSI